MNKPTQKTQGAVIYTRVSTGEQADHGTSLDTQKAACLARAAALGLPIIAHYEDAGVSGGFLATRQGMADALGDLRAGRASHLVCANVSRFSRDSEHQAGLLKAVRAAGGRLVFADATFEDTPEGDLNFTIQGGFAAYERQVIRKRSMDGKKQLAQQGVQTSRCKSPYGFHVVQRADVLRGLYPLEELGRYVQVPVEAAVVRRIFEGFAAGTDSMHSLCLQLNAEGVPTPKGAAAWRPPTIKAILQNPVHCGRPAYGKVSHRLDEARTQETNPLTGRPYVCPIVRRANDAQDWITLSAPPVVSEEVWERAQERRASNRSTKGGRPASVRLLSGRAVCPCCGGGMRLVPAKQEGWHRYQCQHYIEGRLAKLPAACDATGYGVLVTERAAVTALVELAERPDVVEAELAAYRGPGETQAEEARAQQVELARALKDLAAEEASAVQAQLAGMRAGASPDAYAGVFADLGRRRAALEARRAAVARVLTERPRGTATDAGEVQRQAVRDVYRVLTSPLLPAREKRDALGLLVDKVICREGGAEVVFLPGLFGDTVQFTSTPQPRKATVRPSPSSAP